MNLVTRVLLLATLLFGSVAHASLRSAWQARTMLGPDTWARVIRIENSNPRSKYPATLHATVFQFQGILWFYTETDGTQSFSLHRGRLEQEKADFRPLLRDIDPGFHAYEMLTDAGPEFAGGRRNLPNGCFIESVAALQTLIAKGVPVTRASLLSYYVDASDGIRGHTVLAYEVENRLFVLDTALSPEPAAVHRGKLGGDAVKVARAVQGGRFTARVVRAHWVPIALGAPAAELFAEASSLPVKRSEGATGAALPR